jgi:glycosyltransferase involved in cell wall biosynthesis
MISIVVPAHNEERGIGRLLAALLKDAGPEEFGVVVVCNGCTDATADVARGFGSRVLVVEVAMPSKANALREGDVVARGYPRLYVDADVELGSSDVRALCRSLEKEGVLAVAPQRDIPRAGVMPLVRWYYDVWERLPQVQKGLFGRGVLAMSEAGHRRISQLPEMMSDDLVMSEAFAPGERAISTDAVVVIRPPRTWADLIRRRIRVTNGNVQADAAGLRGQAARTGLGTLLNLAKENPRIAPRLPVFIAVTLTARRRARHLVRVGSDAAWLRDESSRT